MDHLSEDSLYRLAELVTEDLPFGDDNVTAMEHIGQCEQCYEKLREYMAVMDMVNNLGILTYQNAQLRTVQEPVQIQIVISPVLTVLEQLVAQDSDRTFEEALQAAGFRGQEAGSKVKKLESIDNEKTFVAYDPVKKLLTVQIDACSCAEAPQALLILPDGGSFPLCFEKHGSVFVARQTLPADGAYRLVLET